MNDREKLIELLKDGPSCPYALSPFDDERCNHCRYKDDVYCDISRLADHMIANGVTVQKWIPVSDMLPRFMQIVLVTDGKHVYKAALNTKNKWIGDYINSMTFKATHWMPMPQPPKGE